MKLFKPLILLIIALCLTACTSEIIYQATPGEIPPAPTHTPAVETPTPVEDPTPMPSPEPTPEPEPTPVAPSYDYSQPVPENEEVGPEWFADAVFVGDSLTDGLRLYGGITEADFICYKGLICQQFSTKECIPLDGIDVAASEALSTKTYGKVFVMLGLNEMGLSTERFAEDYAALIDNVRAIQPEADLYFQLLLPINDQRRAEAGLPSYFNNEKSAAFNAEIARLCEEKQVYFVNTPEGVRDETGQLPYDKTHDGVHLTKSWYQQWHAYLRTHTVNSESAEVTP